MKFVWIIRTWSSLDSFWEHVREEREYEKVYTKPETLLEAIKHIVTNEETEWKDLCTESSDTYQLKDRVFTIEIPSTGEIKTRSFLKFLTITNSDSSKQEFVRNWYIERLKIFD